MDKECLTRTSCFRLLLLFVSFLTLSPAWAGALHDAAAAADIERVRELIASGADVNAKDAARLTPLDYATFMNHKKVVEALIAAGADVNVKEEIYGFTPLHMATKLGHRGLVELLIARGADVEAKAEGGVTPLHWAALMGLTPVAELLIAKGANVNVKDKSGSTPLQWAKAHPDMVDLLKRNGAHE